MDKKKEKKSLITIEQIEKEELNILKREERSLLSNSYHHKVQTRGKYAVVEGTIKDIIGKWNAQDLIANREQATGSILDKLHSALLDNYINVTDFQMTEINYSDVFERAIESKVTAEQDALKAKGYCGRGGGTFYGNKSTGFKPK